MSVITFPSIKVGGKVTQEVIRHTPQPPSKSTLKKSSRNNRHLQGRSSSSEYKYESSPSPDSLTKGKADNFIDTARYRNSYKHNLCLDMLQDGFHMAYCELFELFSRQREKQMQKQGDSSDVDAVYLEDDPEKLDTLKENLISAETAKRRGRSDHVYESYLALAEYFLSKKDIWLADHFYKKCLESSLLIGNDGGKREAEANFKLGLSAEKKQDFMLAMHHMEKSYTLSKKRDWADSNGVKFQFKVSEGLQRLYTAMAEKIEDADPDQALEYLQKAFQTAQEAGNEKQVGKAEFRLGRAYEEYGDSDAAIKLFADYLEICNTLRDDDGKAQACKALADAYHTLGDVNNSIEYLTMYLDIAKRLGNREMEGSACSRLAALYNSLGQYTLGTEYCHQAFQSSKESDKLDVIAMYRTECGVISANEMFEKFAKYIISNQRVAVARILSWRDSRTDFRPPSDAESSAVKDGETAAEQN